MTIARLLFAAILIQFLSGCATLLAPNYSPDYEAIDKLKKLNLQKISVGEFQPRDPNAPVNKISLRGASLKAP